MTNELRWKIGEDFHDHLAEGIYADASEISESAVFKGSGKNRFRLDRKIDEIVTSKTWGFPIMFLLLGLLYQFQSRFFLPHPLDLDIEPLYQ